LTSCSGTKKYFKAAERLEKQGLVNEAAEYYLESLQRKPTNVQARIKLKEVGQKFASNLSAEFFRNYNTQQLEASLESFERLKEFTGKTSALSVNLDYPKGYEEDYQKAVESYCSKNYNQAYALVNQKKYNDALNYIKNVKKYNPTYKTTQQLEIVSVCEPLYQNAVTCIENKNYSGALNLLTNIKSKTEQYKDMQDLLQLASAQQTKSFILFEPKSKGDRTEQEIEDQLFSDFNQAATQKFPYAKIINNTPFKFMPDVSVGGADLDLIQAVRKATGADFFYLYDVSAKKEFNSGPQKSNQTAYLKQTTTSGTVVTVSYNQVGYSNVKSSRSFSYQYKYKLINAFSNQIISSQTQNVVAQDGVEYNEFSQRFNQNNLNNLFPYNPAATAPVAQYNPGGWRKLFSANTNLKSFDQLKSEALNQTVNLFTGSVSNHIK
jgi:ribosomal protein L22